MLIRLHRPYNTTNFEANKAGMKQVTEVLVPKLAALTPGGAAYLNEGDPNQPDFQHVFYGASYSKLKCIKEKYDPLDILYGRTAVGSDQWQEQDGGRLCKTK